MRRLLTVLATSFALGTASAVLPLAPASAADTSTITKCVRDDAGRFNCTKYVYKTTGKVLLLANTVKNTGKTTLKDVNCGFSDSASFSTSYSATVSGSVKASWMSVISAEAGFSVTATVGVTATQASTLSVTTTLKPGQSLRCNLYAQTVKYSIERYATINGVKQPSTTVTVNYGFGKRLEAGVL